MYHGIVSALCRFRFEKNIVHDQGFGGPETSRMCLSVSVVPRRYTNARVVMRLLGPTRLLLDRSWFVWTQITAT